MALKYALLASLNETPATGYEMTQRFRERLCNVWNASHQQVYRELSQLLERQWVAVETVPQSDKPDRKVYRITPDGRQALGEWVNTPSKRPPTRDPLLLKLFAGDLWEGEQLLEELERHEQTWREQLEAYRETEARYFSEPESMPRHYRLQYMALKRGIQATEGWLEWAREVRATLGGAGD